MRSTAGEQSCASCASSEPFRRPCKQAPSNNEGEKKKKRAQVQIPIASGKKKKQASVFANNKTHLPSLYVLSPFLYSIIVDVTILSYLHETHHHIRFEQNVHPIMLFVTVLFLSFVSHCQQKVHSKLYCLFFHFFPFQNKTNIGRIERFFLFHSFFTTLSRTEPTRQGWKKFWRPLRTTLRTW